MCNFNLPFSSNAADFASKIKKEIEDAGGTFNGNDSSGSFSVSTPLGRIEGNYTINGEVATVEITKKPFVLTCNQIEEFAKKSI